MDTTQALTLLGGISPEQFMRRYWQKRPLLVRGAVPGFKPLFPRAELLGMAGEEGVESRLVTRVGESWRLQRGPFARRSLPPLSRPDWTLLVQGVDLHRQAGHDLLRRFDFIPQARLDDLMISYATNGGGVGPHFDSYDVFLLQAQGQRRWRIGRQRDLSLVPDLPVKILANFTPEQEYVLEPGDMLYLPPRWAHDGIAQGECQTYSIGFRVPRRGDLARELLGRLAEDAEDIAGDLIYRDADQPAVGASGAIPGALQEFAAKAITAALSDPMAVQRALGEYLTEPKANVWFDAGEAPATLRGIVLDRRTRMAWDQHHVFANGESWRAAGRDATLLRRLADQRRLGGADIARASAGLTDLLLDWCEAGWAHPAGEDDVND